MNTRAVLKGFLEINFIVLKKMNASLKKIIYMLLMFGMCLK